jgi:hypothetical protein
MCSHHNSLLAAFNTNTGICDNHICLLVLGQGFRQGFTDVFAGKPAVKKHEGMLIFIPLLKVILIDMSALFEKDLNKFVQRKFIIYDPLYH